MGVQGDSCSQCIGTELHIVVERFVRIPDGTPAAGHDSQPLIVIGQAGEVGSGRPMSSTSLQIRGVDPLTQLARSSWATVSCCGRQRTQEGRVDH